MSKPPPPKPPPMKGGPPPPPPGPKGGKGPPPPPPGPASSGPPASKPKALLGSIENFKKGGLRKVDKSEIRDSSAPVLKTEKKAGGPAGGPMGMPMMLPPKKSAGSAPPSSASAAPLALPGMGMKKAAPGKPAPPSAKPPSSTSPMRMRDEDSAPAPARGPPGGKGMPLPGFAKPGGAKAAPAIVSAPPAKKAAPPVPKPKPKAAANGTTQARALYAYAAQRNDELSFNEGDTITVLAKNADGWWEGELNGYRGVFPGNYVEEVKGGKQVRSQWAYTAQRPDELSFGEGDIITVLEEKGNWHRGECKGRTGLFPANYVVPI